MNTESIVYLLRKTNITRSEIGKLTPKQFNEILKEVIYQESLEDYRNQFSVASILAAIYNTIPRKKGSHTYKPSDFYKGEMPSRNPVKEDLDEIAEKHNVKLPTKELYERNQNPSAKNH